MRKYISFFRLRFLTGLQYRGAALAGITTQFFWGAMQLLMFKAFYQANPSAFPMTLPALSSYIWMQQAFLALFMVWVLENELFDMISSGNIAYELCRPIDLYDLWFVRSVANRVSKWVLRSVPILLFAAFVPYPYGLSLPKSVSSFFWFFITMILGFLLVIAFTMLVYILTFYTLSPMGVRIVAVTLVEFFSGGVIPLPFLPDRIRKVVELLPFASMQNVPLRIYSGDISEKLVPRSVMLQIAWLLFFIMIGKLLIRNAMKKVVIQGG